MKPARTALLGIALLVLAGTAAVAGWKEVPVDITVPPKLETRPGERVLVALFRGSGNTRLDIGMETSKWSRREIARQTALKVLDVPPPPIPEQLPEKLAVNDVFWKRMGEDFRADLIVAGLAELHVEDRSGFVNEDVESPVTGQMIRRSRYVERRGYILRVQVFFLKGDNGALLHSDTWTEERVLDEGSGAEDLQELFDLLEAMAPHLRMALVPTKVKQPRYIWVD